MYTPAKCDQAVQNPKFTLRRRLLALKEMGELSGVLTQCCQWIQAQVVIPGGHFPVDRVRG